MRGTHLIKILTQVVSLAMVALALTVGSAFAHGGSATSHDQTALGIQTTSVDHQAGDADLGGVPCSNDHQKTGSTSGACCTIACHAALAAPAVEPLGAHEPPSVRVVGLTDMLEGRSSDRTERPPRLS